MPRGKKKKVPEDEKEKAAAASQTRTTRATNSASVAKDINKANNRAPASATVRKANTESATSAARTKASDAKATSSTRNTENGNYNTNTASNNTTAATSDNVNYTGSYYEYDTSDECGEEYIGHMFSDLHSGFFFDSDSSDDYDDDIDDYSEVDSHGSDYSDLGMDDFMYRDNVSVVEAYFRGYALRQNIPASTRARISDFILFLHTLPFSHVSNAFGLFRREFNDMIPYDSFNMNNSMLSGSREGMPEAEISRLARHSYRGQTQKEKRLNEDPHKCCICMAELELGEELILLEKCSHRFHSGCLESWLKRSNKCPICRATINPPPLIIN